MSRSDTPTLPWVLPMYEYMRKHLRGYGTTSAAESNKLPPALLTRAAESGLAKLDEYYWKARDCQYNVIATRESDFCQSEINHSPLGTAVLHPQLGLRWFRKLGDDERVDRAKVLFEHAFGRYQAAILEERSKRPPPAATLKKSSSKFLDDVCMNEVKVPDATVTVVFQSEMERFLALGDQDDELEALEWWKVSCF